MQPHGGGTLADGQSATITSGGTGTDAYHDFSILYDPVTDTQQLLVDDVVIYSDLTGQSNSQDYAFFGSGSSAGDGSGNWHSVGFEIIPAPSTFALSALGVLGLLACGRRGRR